MDMNLGKLQEMVRDRGAWRVAVPGVMDTTWRLIKKQYGINKTHLVSDSATHFLGTSRSFEK